MKRINERVIALATTCRLGWVERDTVVTDLNLLLTTRSVATISDKIIH
jgi:hypothetical protein